MAYRIVFSGKQQVRYESFELPDPGPGQVRIRALYSLMSTGTETIVFNRLFDPGTGWDTWVKYPFFPGYSLVGVIEAVGDDVRDLAVGERVAVRAGHASHVLWSADQCAKVPEELDPRQATWFALAKIAAMAARVAEYRPGDSVLVIGAGPIGQMAARWAFACGAETILVADRVAGRLELARRGGATAVISGPIEQAEAQVLAANYTQKPCVVIDSTGNAAVFAHALRLAADHGRVVILGDTGSPTSQHLTGDVLLRGLHIVGAHDIHNDATWNDLRIARLFFNLVLTGRFSLDGLNMHLFRPDECDKAYSMATAHRDQTMGIVFDWETSSTQAARHAPAAS